MVILPIALHAAGVQVNNMAESSPGKSEHHRASSTRIPTGMDSIWGDSQSPAPEKPKTFQQVTDMDIENDPEKNQNNPVRRVDGEILRDINLRNMGYQPGSFEMINVPVGSNLRFLFKPTYDHEHGVDNWYVQGLDESGASLGVGTISTWRRKGSIITTKDGRKLTVFRPKLIVRR